MTEDAGPGVDAEGRSVADPTANVLALVHAEGRRQDDLREAAEKMAEAEHQHAAELREAESKRVDALRAGDQAAIVALAGQVVATAEAFRVSADATAARFTAALAELQRWQYGQQGGREQVTESQAKSGSIGLWIGLALTALFGLIGAGVGTVGMVVALVVFFTR
jgi:fatty acid/phospholipid biosynthesis enzyme